ncbi:MAG: hypothetical protein A2X36_00425 [Elusimicrobia bacterium GWA2_69_24]|nr:MAG: hypothetical protein A2X36_00425 [Elusimicrobia bacterium GWA2_69_24]HBL16773.1 hypothetical protein [Elusimicrobiota bacterium]
MLECVFGWYGDNDLGERLIGLILSGGKTATACPIYDPPEAAVGERMAILDKAGRQRAVIRITRQEIRKWRDFDADLAGRIGMSLEELGHALPAANSRELSPDEELRVTYFQLVP